MVTMSAVSGIYNMKTEMLTLSDNINLVSSTGYEGRLSEAVIDVREGNVVSEKPVWVKLLQRVRSMRDGWRSSKTAPWSVSMAASR